MKNGAAGLDDQGFEGPPPGSQLAYASFSQRYAAVSADYSYFLPFGWCFIEFGHYVVRLFDVYAAIPIALIAFYNNVYLVGRRGASVGKSALGLRVQRVDGSAVGYREAVVRFMPQACLLFAVYVGRTIGALSVSAADFAVAGDGEGLVRAATPAWTFWCAYAAMAWVLLGVVVMRLNKQRRTHHDFLANTVVVRVDPALPAGAFPTNHPAVPRAS